MQWPPRLHKPFFRWSNESNVLSQENFWKFWIGCMTPTPTNPYCLTSAWVTSKIKPTYCSVGSLRLKLMVKVEAYNGKISYFIIPAFCFLASSLHQI
jgi:hypothetical protein